MFKLVAISNRLTDSDTISVHSSISDITMDDFEVLDHTPIKFEWDIDGTDPCGRSFDYDDFMESMKKNETIKAMRKAQVDEFKKRQQEFQEYERNFDWNAYGRERHEAFLMTKEDNRRG